MTTLESDYGWLEGVTSYALHDNGTVKSCLFERENSIDCGYGKIIPQYTAGSYGERQKKYRDAISFYDNGQIKSVALEKQVIIETPQGPCPAELLTFYRNGKLKRIFPLNGRIDGFWSEEEEGKMSTPITIKTSFGEITTKIIGMFFYPSGALKSVTLWPGEHVYIETPRKRMMVRNGFSLYENGRIKSVEPAGPTIVPTLIGELLAYDKDALGINADENSLRFSENGRIIGLKSSFSGIKVNKEGREHKEIIEPMIVDSLIEENGKTVLPLSIEFRGDMVILRDKFIHRFQMHNHDFEIYKADHSELFGCADCSSCNGC